MHNNRLLKESVEKHAPGSRSPAVKAEGEFVQVGLYVIDAEGALVGAEQPPFHESRNAVDSGEHFVRLHAGTLDGCASMHIAVARR